MKTTANYSWVQLVIRTIGDLFILLLAASAVYSAKLFVPYMGGGPWSSSSFMVLGAWIFATAIVAVRWWGRGIVRPVAERKEGQR